MIEVEADEFAQAQARRVHQLEHGAVAAAKRGRHVRRFEQAAHLVNLEMGRQLLFHARRGDERAGIAFDQALAAQVPHEGAHRRELARRCLPGTMRAVELGEKRTDGCQVTVLGPLLVAAAAVVQREVLEKLRDVAFVRAHRVRRRAAVAAEVREKRLEVGLHLGSHASSTASARAETAVFRSSLFRGGESSGSMMPNVMLLGS